ncbi:hypothetical protein JA13_298 [Dickeya phage vB_DsoM_JA13]|uniref:Uncharacterized protein n=1 Tax=Dickeya phage vB_DsoM_JA13 TaxID=2283030 RepID=A0A384ZWT5_9CAUD|nr:hypothetical protein JA13_298 [Dickeya phage vB_DsoM_JA13]
MKVLDLDKFKGTLAQYAAARKVEEIFSQVDQHMQRNGAIAFTVPMDEFFANGSDVEIVCGQGAMVDHLWDEAETTACINRVLASPEFANWFGGWLVADGTEYMKKHAVLKSEMPDQKIFVFIPEIPVLSLKQILS